MFLKQQEAGKQEYYEKMLKTMGSLSRLFSENDEPYLDSRVAENLFCKSFDADNLSRSDTTADASLNGTGIGIKTFGEKNGITMEKIAEFNAKSSSLRSMAVEEMVKEIARLRNERIETTKKIYALEQMIYHCITRTKAKMHVIETPMHSIDIDSIKILKANGTSVTFSDKHEFYSFNLSKSTLFKRFVIENLKSEYDIQILEDPFDVLAGLASPVQISATELIFAPVETEYPHVYLPLYSTRTGDVEPGSGLNQWNAKGRKRDPDEAYIPIPSWVHKKFEGFFPPREVPFELKLPNKEKMNAKVCQDGDKALMSNPNDALGKWILRDILDIPQGEIVTYEKLADIGLDSVIVYKLPDGSYKIDFAKLGCYEEFEEEYNV